MFAQLFLCLFLGVGTPEKSANSDIRSTVAFSSNLAALQDGNRIGGHIFNKQRRPISQLIIELQNDLGSTIAQMRTDTSGRYEFSGLRQGVYQIRVLTYGTNYIAQTERVDIVNLSVGTLGSGAQYIPLDFVLSTPEAEAPRSVTGVVFAQAIPDSALKLYEQAVSDLDGGKGDQGLTGLQKALDVFPTYFLALERLGIELVKREQYERARTVLNRATETNPRGYQSLYWLGLAQHNLKQTTAAIESFTRAVSIAPTSVNAQLWLGIVLRESGQLDKAEIHLKRAKELGKKRIPEVHWQLALLYNKQGRNREAADELELFLKTQPDSRDAEKIRTLISQLRQKAQSTATPKK